MFRNVSLFRTNVGTVFLQNMALTGTIPTELGRLTELGEFVFYDWNDPPSLCSCRRVGLFFDSHSIVVTAFLLLNGNQVSGSIPTELGNLSSITRK